MTTDTQFKLFYPDSILCPICETYKDKLKLYNDNHDNYHLFDSFSFTHVSWGIIYGLILKKFKYILIANFSFEFIENSFIIVNLYKKMGYIRTYDTYINILGDTMSIITGYLLSKLGKATSIIIIIILETALLLMGKDSILKMFYKIVKLNKIIKI